MVFPATTRDLAVEIFVNSNWVNITSDVHQRDSIKISRGRPNESSKIPPAQCTLTLDNRSGNYSIRNPLGAYYNSLGRNTPLHVAVKTDVDTFTRTVSSGWGSTDSGHAYTNMGLGGTIPSSFNVAAGKGTHDVPSASSYRLSYLPGTLYGDVDISATVSIPFSNVLGGPIEPINLVIGGLATTDYYMLRVTISAAEVIQVAFHNTNGTIYAAPVTVPLTFTGQDLKARFQLEGHTLRGKVWAASANEPYAWTIEQGANVAMSSANNNRAPGWVGIRSGVAAGNTNTFPVVFSYDNLEVRNYRFAGEVSSWPTKWDDSGKDVYTPITASGMTRRLGQGDTPLKSAFYRAFTTMAVPPIVYYPMEDGKEALTMASGIGGAPLNFRGAPKLASNSDFAASKPIPVVNGAEFGDWYSINGAADTGVIQTTFLLSVPTSGDTDTYAFIQVQNGGSATAWNLEYGTLAGGSIRVAAYDRNSVNLLSTGWTPFGVNGVPRWMALELTRSGANINWVVKSVLPNDTVAYVDSGTLVGQTLGALTAVKVNPDRGLVSSAIGHVMSRNYYQDIFSLISYLNAYTGETARARVNRLSTENDVPFAYLYNSYQNSALVGVQGHDTYFDLCNEAVTADKGLLFEGRSTSTLVYRVRNATINQLPTLQLNYASGHIVSPFSPVEDDQQIRNDVKITRKNGSSVRVEKTTGPLAVTNPFVAQGAGRYDTADTLNLYQDSQLPDTASWALHVGTVDEPRYPTISVELAKFSEQMQLDAMAVEIGGRITISNPKAIFDPNLINQTVQGYKEEISNYLHKLTFNCTPGSANDVLRPDTVAWDKVNSGTSTLNASVTSTATSISVATSNSKDLWKVGAGQSIPIMVSGEAMTVTTITGATSPQTFTVTRSTNGVVKAQTSGAAVRLARRATVGL